jgi:arabinan endo-1,5-alpha-L-arabinosidase
VRPAWTLEAVPGHRGGEQGHYWAPDVIQLNGRYLVYYSVSTFGRNTSAIGLASNPTLDPSDANFKWTDHGIVVRSSPADRFNAIDPAVTLDADGKLWMSFGSFWSGIKMIELDPATGLRIAADSPIHSLAYEREIEAPFIYRHGGHYYLFVNWGICCRGVNSTYNIRVGRSEKITGPYVDREGKEMMKSGGTLVLGNEAPMIGPGHAGIIQVGEKYLLGFHFYDPTRRGLSTLAIREVKWGEDGWPLAGK